MDFTGQMKRLKARKAQKNMARPLIFEPGEAPYNGHVWNRDLARGLR